MLRFSSQIGVDLGTRDVRVWVRSRGIVLDEPAVLALNCNDRSLEAAGRTAEVMRGRASNDAFLVSPLKNGTIADIDAVQELLAWLIARFGAPPGPFPTVLMISTRPGASVVERRALYLAARRAGAHKVYLIDSPLAAALGMALPVTGAAGRLVLDLGAGATSASVLALGSVVTARTTTVAGDYLTELLRRYLRTRYRLEVSRAAAEHAKETAGTAARDQDGSPEVLGRDLISGRLARRIVTAEEVHQVFAGSFNNVTDLVCDLVEKTPPDLCADIAEYGVYFAGAGALLRSLVDFIGRRLGTDVVVAGDPRLTVIRGIGKALGSLDSLEGGPAQAISWGPEKKVP